MSDRVAVWPVVWNITTPENAVLLDADKLNCGMTVHATDGCWTHLHSHSWADLEAQREAFYAEHGRPEVVNDYSVFNETFDGMAVRGEAAPLHFVRHDPPIFPMTLT